MKLMQNVVIYLIALVGGPNHPIRPYLDFLSDPTNPRGCCTIYFWLLGPRFEGPDIWSEGGLLDSLRNMTGFKTVVLIINIIGSGGKPLAKSVAEYLSVKLGTREYSSMNEEIYCLIYHPRGAKKKEISI